MRYEDCNIDFPCPECRQTFQVSLHQLFQGAVLTCPICGATNSNDDLESIELNELNQAFKKLEIELLDLQKKLNNEDYSLND